MGKLNWLTAGSMICRVGVGRASFSVLLAALERTRCLSLPSMLAKDTTRLAGWTSGATLVSTVSSRYPLVLFTYVWLTSDEKGCAQRPRGNDDEEASKGMQLTSSGTWGRGR